MVSNMSASATPGKVKLGIWRPRRVTGVLDAGLTTNR
jgi:hypothetical protein